MRRVAQQHPHLRDRGGELRVGRRLVRALPLVDDRRRQLLACGRAGILVAEAQRGDLAAAGAGVRHDLVQRRDRLAGADLAGVLAVVGEVRVGHGAVLVAELAVRLHRGGIELELHLHVVGDGHERRRQLAPEHLLRLLERVEVVVVAVPLAGQHLHRRVLEVVVADADAGEVEAVAALRLDQLLQLLDR